MAPEKKTAKKPETESKPAGDSGESFDERLARLEQIVGELEDGKLELEPAIERYQVGVALLGQCRDILTSYRQQVEELTRNAAAELTPYDGDPDLAGPSGTSQSG